MTRVVLILSLLIFSLFSAKSQNLIFRPNHSYVLDSVLARDLLKQCSRSVPKKVSDVWTPSKGDIEILENNFRSIYTISSNDCCIAGISIDTLGHYAFQYIGVTIKGHKFIYINAFSTEYLDVITRQGKDPRKTPIVICDGGKDCWGILFEIKGKRFKSLSINGIG